MRNISVYNSFNSSNSFLNNCNELKSLSYSCQTMPLESQSEMIINILMCADQNMAVPMIVTLFSAVKTLRNDEKIRAFIFTKGIDKLFKQHVEKVFDKSPIELFWEEINDNKLKLFDQNKHHAFPPIVFYRVLLDELLPNEVSRVIYLDADTLVCRAISDLYKTQLNEFIIGAVTDLKYPWFCMIRGCVPARKNGIPDNAPYFNSGIMVIDVSRYRSEKIGERALHYAKNHIDLIDYADQDALNVALYGHWKSLDPRWNQVSGIHEEHGVMHCHFSREELSLIRNDPWIIHYTGALPRPWVDSNAHPCAMQWKNVFDLTGFSFYRLQKKNKSIFTKVLGRLKRALSILLHG